MDPISKSTITSILMVLAGNLATLGVTNGVIPGADKDSAANVMVDLVLWIITVAIGWYKKQQHTPQAQIDAINLPNNGLKVVKENEAVPAVTKPL